MVTSAYVVHPGDTVRPEHLGGKAGALWRLAAAGFPVPRFAVVTTEAYRAVAERDALRATIADAESNDDATHRAIDDAFDDAPLPDGLGTSIIEAARSVAAADGTIAVRSSATAEDLHGASFAGQYRSFLDVPADERAVDAVRRTWSSLWYPSARRYRQDHGVVDTPSDDGPAMAVVLMSLVRPHLAGVAFTVDPASDAHRVRIECVHGFADRLVSGEATPEVTLLLRDDVASAPGVIGDVARLALRAEDEFGCPQDVEWVWDGSTVQLVQSRPITVLGATDDDGFDNIDPSARCTTAGIEEMLPGFLPPLVWETFGHAVDDAFLTLFADLDALPAGQHSAITRVRGQAALNLGLLTEVAALIPGVTPAELQQQLLGVAIEPEAAPAGTTPTRRSRLAHDVRVARVQRRALLDSEIVLAATDALIDGPPDLASRSDDAVLGYRSRLVALLHRATTDEVQIAAGAAASYERLVRVIAGYVPDQADGLAGDATHGVDGAGELDVWGDLVRRMRRSAEGRRILGTDDPERALALLRDTHDRSLAADFDRTVRRVGSMSIATGPTWAERPELAWRLVRVAAGHRRIGDGHTSADELVHRLSTTRRWRRIRLLTGAVVDSQAVLLRRRVRDAVEMLGRREAMKAAVLTIGGEIRRVHLELGRRLVERGRLGDATDVDRLGAEELEAAVHGNGPGRTELLRRARRGASAAATPLPLEFVGRPSFESATSVCGAALRGWAASPGRFEGTARVVASASDRFEQDEVLVARTTDPSWGPLFLTAGAIVIEKGGPLSHAAIVARELGLPAVVNVPGLMARVHDGDRVLVDGTAGTVTVVGDPANGVSAYEHDVSVRDEGVFVPAVMGAGLLFSAIVIVRDWIDRVLGTERRREIAAAQARLLTHHVLHGDGAADGAADLRRRRRILGAFAGVLLGIAAYLVPGAVANYLRPGGYLAEIGWILAATATLVVASLTLGTLLALSAIHPDRPSPAAVRALRFGDATLHSPLFAHEPAHHDWGRRWHGTASVLVLLDVVAFAVLTLAVKMGSPVLLERDASTYNAVRDIGASTWFDAFGWIGRLETAALAAIAVAILTRRRGLRSALAHPVAVVAALGIGALVAAVVGRLGPAGLTDDVSTYPDPIAVQSTVLVVMIVSVVQRRMGRIVAAPLATVLVSCSLAADLGRVVTGRAWASDVVAGALLGLLVSLLALLVGHPATSAQSARRRLLLVPDRTAALIGRAATVWVFAAVAGFAVLSWTIGIPDNPYAGLGLPALKRTAQIAALVLVAIAAIVALRWRAIGAVMLATAGTVMAVFASIQYTPAVAVGVALLFLLPAFGQWIAWQHGRPLRSLVAPAIVSSMLVTGTWVGATTVYDSYFGPSHPQSALTTLSTEEVVWVWSGGLGHDSASVTARLRHPDTDATATILMTTEPNDGRVIVPTSITRSGLTVSARFEHLAADTHYRYTVVVHGRADLSGTLRTAPSGAGSFTVTFGSCARTASNGLVYEVIAAQRPLLHLVLGDLHYGDVATDDAARLRTVLDSTISAPAQQALYLSTPIAYVWDDHDYGGNDSDANAPARSMAQAVYREYVPHAPLPSSEGIQQSFVLGRVRFVLTDLRSYREPASDGSGSLMGEEELAWFEHELITARDNGQVVVWVSATPWIGGADPNADTWAGFPEQRRQIADFIARERIERLFMLSGDAHMVAIDDGSNSDYSTDGGAGFVVAHGGALDRPGGTKGGPFSEGTFPGGGQFGVLRVIDEGGPTITFVVSGRTWQDREIVSYEFDL